MVTDANGGPVDEAYFLLTGILSGILDNAPTYLVFFHLAGGDAAELMSAYASTLAAISGGAVFMGALTYIGNAPNFMVLAIAKNRGINMPGFFGYMLWSVAILIPCFLLLTWLFFR
jgi:Na+/H+ antiporter NhaD/arsenite permease-like protein